MPEFIGVLLGLKTGQAASEQVEGDQVYFQWSLWGLALQIHKQLNSRLG